MEYAVIKTGGRQFKVSQGDVLLVPHLGKKADEAISFEDVLLVSASGNCMVGKPTVEGALVKALVLGTQKGEKIRVARFMSKVRHRRVRGHRDVMTKIKIQEIVTSAKSVKEAKELPGKSKRTTTKTPAKK